MALRDYDFCATKGGKAFGPYSQQGGGVIGVSIEVFPFYLYAGSSPLRDTWAYSEANRLLLPRELM